MATTPEKPDLKRQFRTMVQGAQSLVIAYIGVVNGLFAAIWARGAVTDILVDRSYDDKGFPVSEPTLTSAR
jgi:hypothetical protein